jgi:hypothetical protein
VLIIAGSLYVRPEERDKWVEAHYEIVKRARSQPGVSTFASQPIRWNRAA